MSYDRNAALALAANLRNGSAMVREIVGDDSIEHQAEHIAQALEQAVAEVDAMSVVVNAAVSWRESKYQRLRSWLAHHDDVDIVSAIDCYRARLP